MKNPSRYTSYKDFFPYYLREHSKRNTRILHYIGTGLGQIILWTSIFTQSWLFIPLAFVCGYAFAWIGHFFIEHNKPATFRVSMVVTNWRSSYDTTNVNWQIKDSTE